MKRVAAIQMASGPNVGANLTEAGRLINRAVDAGAALIVLPENFAIMGMHEVDKVKVGEQPGKGPIQDFLAEQARKHGIWIVGGTLPLQSDDEQRIRAACLLIDDQGHQVARYDKVHLFDVHLAENAEIYNESQTIEPGREATVVDTPFGRLGMAVCYDLRFPELFRSMADQGVDLVALPSAFTAITGKAHWEVLVRARAIENLIYVVAAAQGGYHVNGRETYGHSMIVDPWGMVLDELPNGSGFVSAELDPRRIADTRRNFPALQHRKIPCKVAL
ncbi:carbon-nitrogen hydrolase family protein [Thiohalophilus sp.]|uniref:carbon-nitrogen hydrolase family protein n=1 Tax=Thiohalophilus sp. TaxID=3028392 RepID=UPI002ACD9864|nr:carbon-nitrogen hydrolase family protein [Thiohalophilus sp.]MDZ7662241.1 carbon-nitrogen hydrolase family protein [Thiohalophilus sp.]